ncbi:MAG TPA: D-alanyl-D-alanine carboxypeptidase/D-alanyl-D-alanine-endopeptidase [Gemmatimonadales bacterium]|nr:D-alanyl-D-alanine carboxypeptidase/D-alanyl-D-alanine-endopeptidase [Gemmatimonadales bacterium]
MRRCLLGLISFGLVVPGLSAQSLSKRLDRLLDAPPFDRHSWGVAVLDTTGKVLYQRNATRLFIPASNTKLMVAAAAAVLLPPDGTVMTSLYSAGPVDSGVVRGDLVLYGRGDPTMSHRCFDADTTRPGACESDPMRRLRELATQLRAKGIRTIAGNLVGDGSYFEPTLLHETWEQGDLIWWYAAPVSGLAFNDNSLDVHWGPGPTAGAPGVISLTPNLGDVTIENRTTTVDGSGSGLDVGALGPLSLWGGGTIGRGGPVRTSYVALPDPNHLAASALRQALAEAGISVQGATQSTTDSARYAQARASAPLAESASRPFREWLVPILGPSQNLFAEMLLKQVGKQVAGEGSWQAGLRVERRLLIDSVGADSTQFSLRDGSGLSHVNVVSPLTFARLLLWLRSRPNYVWFESALPVAGRSGTVRNRMVGTPVEGRVKAKTGSIFRVNAFSGYVMMPNGRTRIFSIQANNHDLSGSAMLAQIDSLVVEIGKR